MRGKLAAVTVAVLSFSACATSPSKSPQAAPQLIVNGEKGEILRVFDGGERLVWLAERDEVARTLVSMVLRQNAEANRAREDLAACRFIPMPAPGLTPSKKKGKAKK